MVESWPARWWVTGRQEWCGRVRAAKPHSGAEFCTSLAVLVQVLQDGGGPAAGDAGGRMGESSGLATHEAINHRWLKRLCVGALRHTVGDRARGTESRAGRRASSIARARSPAIISSSPSTRSISSFMSVIRVPAP